MIALLAMAGATELGDAVLANDARRVDRLLAAGADPNEDHPRTITWRTWMGFGKTKSRTAIEKPLSLALSAALRGDRRVFDRLLEAGADPRLPSDGKLPLQAAVADLGHPGLLAVVDGLLEHGAPVSHEGTS
ncbi:MAG: hypothetical protein KC656_32440, partial [Myxococcales bacterium]|nr:hypothetical protein [Myxococcales bacterium]